MCAKTKDKQVMPENITGFLRKAAARSTVANKNTTLEGVISSLTHTNISTNAQHKHPNAEFGFS